MWALVARTFIVYQIATSRGSDVLRRLLGPTFAGILGSDRLPSYHVHGPPAPVLLVALHEKPVQRTRAGEDRAGQTLLSRGPDAAAAALPTLASLPRRSAHPWRSDHPRSVDRESAPHRESLLRLGRTPRQCRRRGRHNLTRALFVHHQHFFTFVHEDGVEPTNNAQMSPAAFETECREPDCATSLNFRPAVSALTPRLTRHKSYGPSSLAHLPGEEGHRDHHHACDG